MFTPLYASAAPNSNRFRRCTRQSRCPICEHPDWCSVSEDGAIVICMRVSDGAIRPTKNGGYLHRLRDDPNWRHRHRTARVDCCLPPDPGFEAMARQCFESFSGAGRAALAVKLGLSVDSLNRLRVGWSAQHGAFSFPMRNSAGRVVGIRLRKPSGHKFAVTGTKDGLFISADAPTSGTLLIAEGPTDCAALLDLGFAAVGRPSCTGATAIVIAVVREHDYAGVVLVADADAPGQRGAEALASTLRLYIRTVRIITPPPGIKDARAWKQAGATRADVQAAIDAAPVRTMVVRGVAR
jgi:hypothetical protein